MKVQCERCGRSHSVAGERPGGGFKMKCESCGHLIVVKPTGTRPTTGGYIDFSLDENPQPLAAAKPLFEQPLGDKAIAAALEEAMGTQPPTEVTDEFVERGPLDTPEAPEEVFDVEQVEPVSEQEAPSALPPVAGAPLGSGSAAAKKGGMSKLVLLGGALVVIVAGVVVVAARKKEPPAPPAPAASAATPVAAPGSQLPPASGPRPAPAMEIKPELAAPDQRYVAPPSPKPYVPPTPAPASRGKRRATEAASQPRPAAAREAEGVQPRATAAPTPAEAQRPRQLESSQVARVVAARRASFNACLAEAARRDPSLEQGGRTMAMLLTVNPSGSVASSVLDDAQLAQTPLATCLNAAAHLMVFPPFQGEPLQVRVPLAFSSRK